MQWRAIEQKNSLGGHRRHHYRASACNALYDPSVGMRSALHADLGSKVIQQLAERTDSRCEPVEATNLKVEEIQPSTTIRVLATANRLPRRSFPRL
jgi:hypothetical protein